MLIDKSDIREAVTSATKERKNRPDVVAFMYAYADNVDMLHTRLMDGTYMELVEYTPMEIANKNGSVRHILSPRLHTLILQHLCRNLLLPYYNRKDVGVGLNCKDGCGITSRRKNHSVLHRAKHLFYDLRQYSHLLCIDQRKCYGHVRVRTLRKALKYLGVPKWLNDFACEICFFRGQFPIGTPTSPLAHHIIMLKYDRWLYGLGGYMVRYADNTYMAFQTREEANTAMWRIKNFWWYELGMRAKRTTAKIYDIDKTRIDICGYVVCRNPDRDVSSHDKGHTSVRESTYKSAAAATDRNWGSYFGLMRWADCYGAMRKIERDMKLSELTERIRIDRSLDADPMDIRELAENATVFTVHDYDLRRKKGEPDWVKCLISIPDDDGRRRAYEFHGGYSYIAEFLDKCESAFGRDAMLPMENVVVENRCGFVFKGSTNVIKYIEEYEAITEN